MTDAKPKLTEHQIEMRRLDRWNALMLWGFVIPTTALLLAVLARFIFWPLLVAVVTGKCGNHPCQM